MCSLIVLAAACGSSSNSGSASTSATTSAPPSTTSTSSPPTTTGFGFGSATTSGGTADAGLPLLILDSPGPDLPRHCSQIAPTSSNWPRWASNAQHVITCTPSSLANGAVIGLNFASSNDLETNLAAYDAVLQLDPSTADATCPTTSGPTGFVQGGGVGGNQSVLECRRYEGTNQPALIWTNTKNNEIFSAIGPQGMSDADLAAWYHANVS